MKVDPAGDRLCVVTGVARFAFYGRPARATAVTCEQPRLPTSYLFNRQHVVPHLRRVGDARFAREACFQPKDHLACVRLSDVWPFHVIYIMWNADNSHVVFRSQAMLPMTNGAALGRGPARSPERRLSNVDAVR